MVAQQQDAPSWGTTWLSPARLKVTKGAQERATTPPGSASVCCRGSARNAVTGTVVSEIAALRGIDLLPGSHTSAD